MKKTINKTIAAILAAAVCTGSGAMLFGCNDPSDNVGFSQGSINLADYAEEYTKPSNEHGELSLKTVGTGYAATQVLGSNCVLLRTGTGTDATYDVYNAKLQKTVVSGVKSAPSIVNWSIYNSSSTLPLIQVSNGSVYDYYALNGQKLIAGTETISPGTLLQKYTAYKGDRAFTVLEINVDGHKVYSVEVENGVEYYTEETGYFERIPTSLRYNGKYPTARPVYTDTAQKPLDESLVDLKYRIEGTSMIFFNKDCDLSSVDITYMDDWFFVGEYMYYGIMELRSEQSGGYDLVDVSSGYLPVYHNYSLHKFHIPTGADTDLGVPAYIHSATPIYNYTTKSYDAAYVSYSPVIDGVKQPGNKLGLFNAELELCLDFGRSYQIGVGIYKRGDGYLTCTRSMTSGLEYTTYDKDMNKLAVLPAGANYISTVDAFSFTDNSGNTGFMDANGYIIASPIYSLYGTESYGGWMRAYNNLDNSELTIISVNGGGMSIPHNDSYGDGNGNIVTVTVSDCGGWFIVNKTTDGNIGSVESSVYLYGKYEPVAEYNDVVSVARLNSYNVYRVERGTGSDKTYDVVAVIEA